MTTNWLHCSFFQLKLALTVPNLLLSEEPPAGITVGEEEEGVVSDPGTEILAEDGAKLKVNLCTQMYFDGMYSWFILYFFLLSYLKRKQSLLLVVSANMTEKEQDRMGGHACIMWHVEYILKIPNHNVHLHIKVAHASNALFACVYSACICKCMHLRTWFGLGMCYTLAWSWGYSSLDRS